MTANEKTLATFETRLHQMILRFQELKKPFSGTEERKWRTLCDATGSGEGGERVARESESAAV